MTNSLWWLCCYKKQTNITLNYELNLANTVGVDMILGIGTLRDCVSVVLSFFLEVGENTISGKGEGRRGDRREEERRGIRIGRRREGKEGEEREEE
jgi:hypothetical protein